jgi:hypothetical protein
VREREASIKKNTYVLSLSLSAAALFIQKNLTFIVLNVLFSLANIACLQMCSRSEENGFLAVYFYFGEGKIMSD